MAVRCSETWGTPYDGKLVFSIDDGNSPAEAPEKRRGGQLPREWVSRGMESGSPSEAIVMFPLLLAACLLLAFVVLALVAGVGIVATLAALVVGAALIAAMAALVVILAARHADVVRRRSSRTRVLSDIRVVESRLLERSVAGPG
jgi:hypothetical protein